MINADKLAFIRTVFYGASGAAFLVFAGIALANGGIPAADSWYTNLAILPGLIGGAVALISLATGIMAGRRSADMAYDEGYRADRDKAQRVGFWTGIWSPLVLALLSGAGIIPNSGDLYSVVMLMAAMFFLSFTYLNLRGEA